MFSMDRGPITGPMDSSMMGFSNLESNVASESNSCSMAIATRGFIPAMPKKEGGSISGGMGHSTRASLLMIKSNYCSI